MRNCTIDVIKLVVENQPQTWASIEFQTFQLQVSFAPFGKTFSMHNHRKAVQFRCQEACRYLFSASKKQKHFLGVSVTPVDFFFYTELEIFLETLHQGWCSQNYFRPNTPDTSNREPIRTLALLSFQALFSETKMASMEDAIN